MRKYNNTGDGDQFNIENVGQFNAPPSAPRDPVLVKLLSAVQKEVKERLAQSLHRAVDAELLNLGKVLEPHQVLSRWTMEMSLQNRPLKPLPPEMTIVEVFELPEVGQQLLILGEPGSGKTTTLLELTQALVERALEDSVAPIPVLVNLSSWKDPQQKIFDWLLGDLKSKYGLRQELGGQFLRQNQLLPCLDGLDEVAPIRQEACAVELNKWLTGNTENQSMGVVVCCRCEEYEKIVRKRLFLENSVALQPLSDEQIEIYLNQFQLGSVWENVQASPQLQDLLRKPIFLAIFGLVAPQFDFSAWKQRTTDADRIEYLFDSCWIVAMERVLVDVKSQERGVLSKTYGTKKLPNRQKVRWALVFVAKAMEQESQTDLLIEKIQPTWLRNRRQQRLYQLLADLIEGLMLGLIFSLIGGLTGGLNFGILGLSLGLSLGLIRGLTADLNYISPIEAIKLPISREARREIFHSLRKYLIRGLIFGLIGGLIVGLIGGLIVGLLIGPIFELTIRGLTVGLIGGLIGWLITGLIVGLIEGLKADIEDRTTPNQGIKNSLRNLIFLTGSALLAAIPFKLLLEHFLAGTLSSDQIFGIVCQALIAFILTSFLAGGGLALVQHTSLRIVLAWNGYAPYRYDKLLDYCTERLLLQRIGGRYRFMHKLLQEHFAKMPLD
jgi:DNA polymerase III delta prime subunit